MIYNIITVAFGALRKVTSLPINYKYDIGQILKITGLELPESYVVDFCNQGDSSTISMVGTADGVRIPDEFLQTGKPVKAYIVLSGEDNTQTRYEITIPVNPRPERTDIQPTPEEQSTIDSLIAAMNTAVEESGENADRAEEAVSHYPKIENGNWYVWNPETGAYEDTGIQAEGEDGVGIQSATLNADYTLTLTFTDGTSYTTPSIRGEPGQHGQDGVSPTITVTAITGGHRVEITDAEGTKTFNVMDGETGATPNLQIGTVTTLPAESEATAEITGTPEQPRLNLGIPKGQQGLPGEVTQAQLDTALANKADIITDTASGAIASFPDGADGLPLKSLVASIEPVQDLHGYDSPWPAGGRKNLVETLAFDDYTQNGVTWHRNNDGSIVLNGTASARSYRYLNGAYQLELVPGTYTVSCSGLDSGAFANISYSNTRGGSYAGTFGTLGSNVINRVITVTSTVYVGVLIDIPVNTVNSNRVVKIQLELGSTATAWSPYENECPISGWTGAEIQGTGKNLLNDSVKTENATWVYFNSTGLTTDKTMTLPAGTYTITIVYSAAYASTRAHINVFRVNPYERIATAYNATKLTFTLTKTEDILIWMQNSGLDLSCIVSTMLVQGSDTADYSPYTGSSLSINWQDEAGTVYGGTLAIDEDGGCVLTATYADVDLGTLDWNVSDRRFNTLTPISNAKGGNHADCLCSIYKSDVGAATRAVDCSICFANNGYVYIYDTTFSGDASAFKAAMNGVQLVCELATPITYTLPDVTMLETVLGTNNIWVDTWDTTVEYRADTKKYIQKIIAQALNS